MNAPFSFAQKVAICVHLGNVLATRLAALVAVSVVASVSTEPIGAEVAEIVQALKSWRNQSGQLQPGDSSSGWEDLTRPVNIRHDLLGRTRHLLSDLRKSARATLAAQGTLHSMRVDMPSLIYAVKIHWYLDNLEWPLNTLVLWRLVSSGRLPEPVIQKSSADRSPQIDDILACLDRVKATHPFDETIYLDLLASLQQYQAGTYDWASLQQRIESLGNGDETSPQGFHGLLPPQSVADDHVKLDGLKTDTHHLPRSRFYPGAKEYKDFLEVLQLYRITGQFSGNVGELVHNEFADIPELVHHINQYLSNVGKPDLYDYVALDYDGIET